MGRKLQMSLGVTIIFALTTSHTATDALQNHDKTSTHDCGPWTVWSMCSQTCGYGTVYRIRQFHALHQQRYESGLVCQGQSKQYKMCILKNCTHGETDYRAEECSRHNSVLFGQTTHTWIPYINNMSPCELSCRSVASEYYARFQKTVPDFVICNEQNTAVCIEGKCVESGCDGVLGSEIKVDRCGVCEGDGTTCRVIHGIFTRTHFTHRGYNIITTIPEGASSINITEMGRSSNHLALSTSFGYFLNGDMHLQPEGLVTGAGTIFNYGRGTGQQCPGECLTTSGRLNISLRVELIYLSRNPGIYYQYTVPREKGHDLINPLTPSHDEEFPFQTSEDRGSHQRDTDIPSVIPRIRHGKPPIYISEEYTQTLLQQHQIPRQVTAFQPSSHYQPSTSMDGDSEDLYISSNSQRAMSSDALFTRDTSYETSHPTHAFKHDNSRHVEIANHVSQPLANNNVFQNRDGSSSEYIHYYHTNEHDDIGDIPVVAPFSDHSQDLEGIIQAKRPKWLPSKSSNGNSRYTQLQLVNQNQPSARSSSRHAVVVATLEDPQSVDPTRLRGSSKSSQSGYDRLENTIPGHDGSHHLYSWRISGFTTCSEACGGGLHETRIVCVKHDSQVEVMDQECSKFIRPDSTVLVCNSQPCDVSWQVGEWSVCSVTCGRGLQFRAVECKQRISPTLTLSVGGSGCLQSQPQARQYCQLDPCFTWRMSNWSKCSSECGFGQRTRTMFCVNASGDGVNDSLCLQDRPSVEEICDMGSCAQGWFHTRWSQQCSVECGKGHYTRQVYCSAADGTRLDGAKCVRNERKPSDRKSCRTTKPCGGQWFTGPWSQCSTTCGTDSYRQRHVMCIKRHGKKLYQIVKEHNCNQKDRPSHKEPCGPFPSCSPQWFVMSWTQCSHDCGTGVKTREVKCLDASFTPSPSCDKDSKPSRKEPCNTQICTEKSTSISVTALPITDEDVQKDGSVSTNSHPVCKDSQSTRWCEMAKQARLCRYIHYRRVCCHTCTRLNPNPP